MKKKSVVIQSPFRLTIKREIKQLVVTYAMLLKMMEAKM